MKKEIVIACQAAGELSITQMTPLQDDFKILTQDRYEELKTQILEEGFSSPIFIWEDPEDAKLKILDGHQRHSTLSRMKEEGYIIPQIPVAFIEADDVQQAIRKLAGFASQYGQVQDEGFARLLSKYNVDLSDLVRKIHIPNLNMDNVLDKIELEINPIVDPFKPNEEPEETNTNSALPQQAQIKQVQLFYSMDDHKKFTELSEKLMEERDVLNLSDLILELLIEADSN